MDLGLRDRVFIVTGGSGGLGRATAEALVADGARVVLSGRTRESVDTAATELGEGAVGVVADNADPATPGRLVECARQTWGRIDGVLISVGGPPATSVLATGDEAWRTAFDSVFLGAVRLAREVGGSLGPGGTVTLVLSSSVHSPLAGPCHLQRAVPGSGHGRQDARRRARPVRGAGQRAAARPDRHHAGT